MCVNCCRRCPFQSRWELPLLVLFCCRWASLFSPTLSIFWPKSAFSFLAEVKFMSRTLAYGTSFTSDGKSHVHFTWVQANLPRILVHASMWSNTLATCEHDSESPALHPKQWADLTIPSFSAIFQTEINASFILWECLTFPVTTCLPAISSFPHNKVIINPWRSRACSDNSHFSRCVIKLFHNS